MGVGSFTAVQSFADFQAIQYYRVQWLLAAVAAFMAGLFTESKLPPLTPIPPPSLRNSALIPFLPHPQITGSGSAIIVRRC